MTTPGLLTLLFQDLGGVFIFTSKSTSCVTTELLIENDTLQLFIVGTDDTVIAHVQIFAHAYKVALRTAMARKGDMAVIFVKKSGIAKTPRAARIGVVP